MDERGEFEGKFKKCLIWICVFNIIHIYVNDSVYMHVTVHNKKCLFCFKSWVHCLVQRV